MANEGLSSLIYVESKKIKKGGIYFLYFYFFIVNIFTLKNTTFAVWNIEKYQAREGIFIGVGNLSYLISKTKLKWYNWKRIPSIILSNEISFSHFQKGRTKPWKVT